MIRNKLLLRSAFHFLGLKLGGGGGERAKYNAVESSNTVNTQSR